MAGSDIWASLLLSLLFVGTQREHSRRPTPCRFPHAAVFSLSLHILLLSSSFPPSLSPGFMLPSPLRRAYIHMDGITLTLMRSFLHSLLPLWALWNKRSHIRQRDWFSPIYITGKSLLSPCFPAFLSMLFFPCTQQLSLSPCFSTSAHTLLPAC